MNIRLLRSVAFAAGVVAAACVIGCFVYPHDTPTSAAASSANQEPSRDDGRGGTSGAVVHVTDAERQALGITTALVQYNQEPVQVRMSATTALNPLALAHVHPRFAGEATRVMVRLGQRVKKRQPLAVVWSKDLGEKKSEFVDARSQLRLNQQVVDRMKEPLAKGAIPERTYMQAVRDLEQSRIAFERARRTLISWRLTEDEIKQIEQASDSDWPRETVRAPLDGTVVESNVVPGELVDPTMNLFVVSDLTQVAIWAYASEEDVLKLHAGDRWKVHVKALPGKTFKGEVGVVGAVVDPIQHTATVQGLIDNPDQLLKAGMFATATVSLPPRADLVIVPTSALIDRGDRTLVYVQSPKGPDQFLRREVEVKERLKSEAFLAGGVRPGEKVVTRGALELGQKGE